MTYQFKLKTFLAVAFLILMIAGSFAYSVLNPKVVEGSTLAFAVPKVASSSPMAVTTTASVIMATSSACVSRVISTTASPIQLTFGGLLTPTALVGHTQAASTTVVYNNGDYGCGQIQAYAFSATVITITQLTQ